MKRLLIPIPLSGGMDPGTRYGASLSMTMDEDYVLTISLLDQNNEILSTQSVDTPIEATVVNGRYDAQTQSLILVLQNGNEITIPVSGLISGLQAEITTQNPLSADLLANGTNNKVFTATDKEKLEKVGPSIVSDNVWTWTFYTYEADTIHVYDADGHLQYYKNVWLDGQSVPLDTTADPFTLAVGYHTLVIEFVDPTYARRLCLRNANNNSMFVKCRLRSLTCPKSLKVIENDMLATYSINVDQSIQVTFPETLTDVGARFMQFNINATVTAPTNVVLRSQSKVNMTWHDGTRDFFNAHPDNTIWVPYNLLSVYQNDNSWTQNGTYTDRIKGYINEFDLNEITDEPTIYLTQAEFNQIQHPLEGVNYVITGNTVQMEVVFTDQTTATYNVMID